MTTTYCILENLADDKATKNKWKSLKIICMYKEDKTSCSKPVFFKYLGKVIYIQIRAVAVQYTQYLRRYKTDLIPTKYLTQ